MTRSTLARRANVAGALIIASLVFVTLAVTALSALLPDSGGRADVIRPSVSPLTGPDELGLNEGAWLTEDCELAGDWPEGEIPASAVVRDAESGVLDRVDFDTAWTAAEASDVWVVALCGEAAA